MAPWLSFPRDTFFIVKFDTNELKSTYFGCIKGDLSLGLEMWTSSLGYRYLSIRDKKKIIVLWSLLFKRALTTNHLVLVNA